LKESERVYFSSNLAFLLYLADGRREPDPLGWFQVFCCEHTLGARTTFRNVQRLLPATHLCVAPDGGLQETRYWRLMHQPDPGLDPVVHSESVFDAFRQGAALRARLASKGVVALSGGLDSRLVAAALPERAEFTAFTFANSADSSATDESLAAAAVCEGLGLKQHVQPIAAQAFSRDAKDVISLTGGLRPLQHMAIVMLYVRELKRLGLGFLLGGGPGDVIAGSKIPSPDFLDGRKTAECLRRFHRWISFDADCLRLLFRDEVARQSRRELEGSLFDSFEGVAGPTAAHKVTAWAMVHRWPAFTFTSVMHNHPDVTEAFCHLDYRFCDLMLKLPAEWLYKQQFYKFMIHNCLPQLRHVIYANTGRALDGTLTSFVPRDEPLWSEATALLRRLARRVVPRPLVRVLRPRPSGTASLEHSLLRADKRLIAEMRETLEESAAMRELVDPAKCLRFLNDFQNGSLRGLPYQEQTTLIGGLATMCLAFRHLRV
jgi:asparagine synthetase B (glutamine-hydrolysing)